MIASDFFLLQRSNLKIWFLLAFQAGAINAGALLACGRFVTHTTGFATFFGNELAQGHWAESFGMLTVPLFFFLGAMISAYFVDLPMRSGRRPRFQLPAVLITGSLFSVMVLGEAGVFGLFGETLIRKDYLFMVLLCLASGLQNALITNANGVVVRTTHLTGITTDLAVGIVRLLFGEDGEDGDRDRLASVARFGLILSFILGAALSALLFLKAKYLGFFLPFLTSLILLRYFSQRKKPGASP